MLLMDDTNAHIMYTIFSSFYSAFHPLPFQQLSYGVSSSVFCLNSNFSKLFFFSLLSSVRELKWFCVCFISIGMNISKFALFARYIEVFETQN